MKYKIVNRLLYWLMYWAEIIEGIIGVLSLGFIHTSFPFNVAMMIMDHDIKNFSTISKLHNRK